MISKEEFCNIINKLKIARDLDDGIQEVISKHNKILKNDFLDSYGLRISHEDTVISLLENMFDSEDISYFVYELDFGREYEDGMVTETDKDGNEVNVDFSCAENLYDYLTRRDK